METKLSSGSELFIVDNTDDDWKVLRYLQDWCGLSKSIDIATGYFEIGSLLALDGEWQKVDSFRILMGDEVTQRTRKVLCDGIARIKRILDYSIEKEKEKNDFLNGTPGIVDALKNGKIQCRVYSKKKFHAKTFITHARQEVIGSFALVGSSNFTYPGLTENVELNVQLVGRQVNPLQEWYDQHWDNAEDVSEEILKTIGRHTFEYPPFDVYVKSLFEFFRGHQMTAGEWELAGPEKGGSHVYPALDQYQKEGYQSLMQISRRYGGAFLCDGVGLGKTFMGLMLIERLVIEERKRVLLLVPKAAREDVWEVALKKYLPHIAGDFSNLVVMNHTDLGRGGDYVRRFEKIKNFADAIIIDEAHHFRNPGIKGEGERTPSRYRILDDLISGPNGNKLLFMLTATPINNSLGDFRHMTELFTRRQEDYFRPTLGISSLRGHFIKMEKELGVMMGAADKAVDSTAIDLFDAENKLSSDQLFKALVVQRSRAYVKESQKKQGGKTAIFPNALPPSVVPYNMRTTYGELLSIFARAFSKTKPLFALGIYYPLFYAREGNVDRWEEGRQKEVVGLIRTNFLKRFESSVKAFESSCDRLLLRLLGWIEKNSTAPGDQRRLARWKEAHNDLLGWVKKTTLDLCGHEKQEDNDEDFFINEFIESAEKLSEEEFDVPSILADCYMDLDQLIEFLRELRKFEAAHDDKIKALVNLLKTDAVCKEHKVLIFSEFADTARYVAGELKKAGITGVDQIDSATKKDRSAVIRRFAPYYNGCSSAKLEAAGEKEIRILVSTDVLSEGLNLQDATRLINYDIHWNPVRLMQRIGRVDRRMNPSTEEDIKRDHPERAGIRGTIAYWNFLPPAELNELLTLYKMVQHKTLRISKTFGIEGKKLLHPDDDYDALKNFNHQYEGDTTPVEKMHLEYQDLVRENPGLEEKIKMLPGRVFSGKENPVQGIKAVFLCYRIPKPDLSAEKQEPDGPEWTEEAGETVWCLFNVADGSIAVDASSIIGTIRCQPETPRKCRMEQNDLTEMRKTVEKYIKNSYLKSLQAPIGVKPILKAWMELS